MTPTMYGRKEGGDPSNITCITESIMKLSLLSTDDCCNKLVKSKE